MNKLDKFRCAECGREYYCPTCGRSYKNAQEVAKLVKNEKKPHVKGHCDNCKTGFLHEVGKAMQKAGRRKQVKS